MFGRSTLSARVDSSAHHLISHRFCILDYISLSLDNVAVQTTLGVLAAPYRSRCCSGLLPQETCLPKDTCSAPHVNLAINPCTRSCHCIFYTHPGAVPAPPAAHAPAGVQPAAPAVPAAPRPGLRTAAAAMPPLQLSLTAWPAAAAAVAPAGWLPAAGSRHVSAHRPHTGAHVLAVLQQAAKPLQPCQTHATPLLPQSTPAGDLQISPVGCKSGWRTPQLY